jgi:glutamate dehydrogenase
MAELTQLFAQPTAAQLMPAKSEADGHAGLRRLRAGLEAVETIESLAAFLFAAVSVQRPAGMSLAQFLQVGMALRERRPASTRWSAA